MKKLYLMLLGALLSQTAFVQTSGGHFLYTYDGTGNITSTQIILRGRKRVYGFNSILLLVICEMISIRENFVNTLFVCLGKFLSLCLKQFYE